MEETFYKRVSVKEELPEKCNNATFSEWVTVYSYETCLGEAMYDFENQCWQLETNALHDKITDWLKPLPILSRDKMIEAIKAELSTNTQMLIKDKAEQIADAILKAGLPEKKVEIKVHGKCNCGESPSSTANFCPNCGSKITWK